MGRKWRYQRDRSRERERESRDEAQRLREEIKEAKNPPTARKLAGMIGAQKRQITDGEADLARHLESLIPLQQAAQVESVNIARRRQMAAEYARAKADAERGIKEAEARIAAIVRQDEREKDFLLWLFGDKSLSPLARRLVAEQDALIRTGRAVIDALPPPPEIPAAVAAARAGAVRTLAHNLRHALGLWKGRLAGIEETHRRLKLEEAERGGKDKALAAAYTNRTRVRAEAIKAVVHAEQIRRCPRCPYCDKAYGPEPCADHIYAVSRGGLSTLENMVYVCLMCNQRKSDLTLREFILKYGLDRDRVERTLTALGKAFGTRAERRSRLMSLLLCCKYPWELVQPAVYFFVKEEAGTRRVTYVGMTMNAEQRICPKGHHVRKRAGEPDEIHILLFWTHPNEAIVSAAERCFITAFRPAENRKRMLLCGASQLFCSDIFVEALDPQQRVDLADFLTRCPFMLPDRGREMRDEMLAALVRLGRSRGLLVLGQAASNR